MKKAIFVGLLFIILVPNTGHAEIATLASLQMRIEILEKLVAKLQAQLNPINVGSPSIDTMSCATGDKFDWKTGKRCEEISKNIITSDSTLNEINEKILNLNSEYIKILRGATTTNQSVLASLKKKYLVDYNILLIEFQKNKGNSNTKIIDPIVNL